MRAFTHVPPITTHAGARTALGYGFPLTGTREA